MTSYKDLNLIKIDSVVMANYITVGMLTEIFFQWLLVALGMLQAHAALDPHSINNIIIILWQKLTDDVMV